MRTTDKKLKELDRWLRMNSEWEEATWFSRKKYNIRFIARCYFPYWLQRFWEKTDALPLSNIEYVLYAFFGDKYKQGDWKRFNHTL